MTWFVKAVLKASLAWLALGVTLGVAMAAHPVWTVYRLAHVHMLLLGFVTMMIYGVAYHVVPRFAGYPLHRPAAARAHWWIANGGLLLMVAGFVVRAHRASLGTVILATGGTLSALGAYTFVYLLWRTIDGPKTLRAGSARARTAMEAGAKSGRRPLTVVAQASGGLSEQ
jgi:cbb3-type cytochrome oxidase subunit 1